MCFFHLQITSPAGSPKKESLASRLQRKTISFLPTEVETASDKTSATKSLLETRRAKRLGLKFDGDGGDKVEIKSSSAKSLPDGDRDRTFDPSKIAVKSLADIRRERKLRQEEEVKSEVESTDATKSVESRKRNRFKFIDDNEGPPVTVAKASSAVLVKSLADIRREKRLQREGGKEVKGQISEDDPPEGKDSAIGAKKSPDGPQQTKKLTDRERRERRARIWGRDLDTKTNPVSSSEGSVAKVQIKKAPAAGAGGGLKVKSLEEIRKDRERKAALQVGDAGRQLSTDDDKPQETRSTGKRDNWVLYN